MGALEASPRASGSALEALWARLERHLGVQEVTLREDFEPKMKIDSGNADFLKSMLSPRREHRFWGPEGPKMEPRTHLDRSCEAKRAEEERKSARDDARSAPEATFATHPARFGVSKGGLSNPGVAKTGRAGPLGRLLLTCGVKSPRPWGSSPVRPSGQV